MTQNDMILNHLQKYGSITAIEAMNRYGIMRLASRINDLKRKGHNISSIKVKVVNRYGEECCISRYTLI